MKAKLQHFLCTRFNVGMYHKHTTEGFENLFGTWTSVSPNVWMTKRLDIFKRYCVPSVLNQMTHDFTWVIHIDSGTPDYFRNQLQSILAPITPIQFIVLPCRYSSGVPSYRDDLERFIREQLAKDTTRILTTRLDNDDLLDRTFIERLNKVARSVNLEQRSIVGIEYLYGYFLRLPRSLRKADYVCNQFCSAVEVVTPTFVIQTIWSIQHGDLSKFGPVVRIDSEPGWVVLIHGGPTGNAGNSMRGVSVTQTASYMKEHFALNDFSQGAAV